jgi:hypothetical protein
MTAASQEASLPLDMKHFSQTGVSQWSLKWKPSGNWGEEHLESQVVRLRMNSSPEEAGFDEPI